MKTEIEKLIKFCIEWKGNDLRYEEELLQETVETIDLLYMKHFKIEVIGKDDFQVNCLRQDCKIKHNCLKAKWRNELRNEQREKLRTL